ncbi:breast cancer anti-estrogen resistance protein 3 homolog isoform X2 [Diabrotica virgifera virgifera]|uniref:Breast cancer anti-estrogen resistance protein 3 homolog isoform X2 n=1 Tax=Diabrotica virgifera virgifera TaxID=50390 RepID=A0A6P7FI59_DIAVI|nr:breast cancer anti-estrogen resistance protein 3 homolog isoform X2 [Diabrotica virgifera virgifera]
MDTVTGFNGRIGTHITWSKFGSLPLRSSKSRLKKENPFLPAKKHKDVSVWLRDLELEEYQELFQNYQGVEDLLEMSEQDIKELGVKKSSHRARIISSLTCLRAKYHETIRVPPIRHSVAVDHVNKIHREDTLTDLRVVSEAVQSKSLNNLIMEPMADPSMNAADLRKTLEWELSLDSRDLRSHAWYHGAIPRLRAEEIVREEGEFLIRDCTSQPGNYVLSCRTKMQALHFVINKQILQRDTVYERVQYQFEDEAFDTVPDLITFYVGSGKPITVASGARIQIPRNRMYPLSFYASKYPTPLLQSRLTSPASTPVGHQYRHSPLQPYRPSNSPTRPSRDGAPRLPSKKQRSQSLTPSEVNRISQEKCNSADGVIQSPLMTRSAGADTINHNHRFSSHSLPRNPHNKLSLSCSANTLGRDCRNRMNSDNTLSPCSERRFISGNDLGLADSPPPKPSRVPCLVRTESKDSDVTEGRYSIDGITHGGLQRVTSYHASGSDSGNGSGDSAMSSVTDTGEVPKSGGVVIKNPRYNMSTSESSTTLKNFEIDWMAAEEKLSQIELPECDLSSRFDLENFQTLLLPVHENKPLDAQALRRIKMTLFESGPRILANHLTRTDLDLIFGTRGEDGVKSKLTLGLNLCALPHGHQFRMDLIERTECLKLLVAVTILTCADESERTDTLNKWIEVAIDTKTALGNLFGFCGIMLGLCLPQIEKLNTTWHMLRQKYTDSAFNFEAKLRPMLKNMNSCSNPQAPNTTIPHLLPLILLLERNLNDFLTINDQNQLVQTSLGFWEWNTQDFGIGTLLNHMEQARKYLEMCSAYQRNAEIVLGEARTDELTIDIFRTEFQLKFLWGSRGAFANANERHTKFEQVLTVMAEKYCNLKSDSEV